MYLIYILCVRMPYPVTMMTKTPMTLTKPWTLTWTSESTLHKQRFVFKLEICFLNWFRICFCFYMASFLVTVSQAMWLEPFPPLTLSHGVVLSASSFRCLHTPITASLCGSLMENAGRRWVAPPATGPGLQTYMDCLSFLSLQIASCSAP